MRSTPVLTTLYALVLLLSLSSCRKTTDPEMPNQRGDKILDSNLSSGFSRLLNFSPDGDELYYLAQPAGAAFQIRAINVQTKRTRLIAQHERWQAVYPTALLVSASQDGRSIYLAVRQLVQPSTQLNYYLYRVSTESPGQITMLDSLVYNDRLSYELKVAPAGNRLSFTVSYDSVRIYDLTGLKVTPLAVSRCFPVTFSPDGQQLLGSVGGNRLYRILSFPSLSTTDIPLQAPVISSDFTYRRGTIVWQANGIQYVYPDRGSSGYTTNLWNATQQTSTLVYSDATDEFPIQESAVVWSGNGQRLAFTTSSLALSSRNTLIYCTDLSRLKTAKVATVWQTDTESSLYVHSLTFSSDNSRLAYVINGSIYVLTLPS